MTPLVVAIVILVCNVKEPESAIFYNFIGATCVHTFICRYRNTSRVRDTCEIKSVSLKEFKFNGLELKLRVREFKIEHF